jgi:hypothetical protein
MLTWCFFLQTSCNYTWFKLTLIVQKIFYRFSPSASPKIFRILKYFQNLCQNRSYVIKFKNFLYNNRSLYLKTHTQIQSPRSKFHFCGGSYLKWSSLDWISMLELLQYSSFSNCVKFIGQCKFVIVRATIKKDWSLNMSAVRNVSWSKFFWKNSKIKAVSTTQYIWFEKIYKRYIQGINIYPEIDANFQRTLRKTTFNLWEEWSLNLLQISLSLHRFSTRRNFARGEEFFFVLWFLGWN